MKSFTTRGNAYFEGDNWPGLVGITSTFVTTQLPTATPELFWRLISDGATLSWLASVDGVAYRLVSIQPLNDFVGNWPDQIGFGGQYNRSTGFQVTFNVQRWVFSQ